MDQFLIGQVAWAVQPGSNPFNRSTRLVSSLQAIGVLDPNCTFYHHGRTAKSAESKRVRSIYPALPERASGALAVLSPVFQLGNLHGPPAWRDYYDDWSLAPDINAVHRAYSSHSYRGARKSSSGLITVNSAYMAGKLRLSERSIVPNGVDKALGEHPSTGDSARRLILLGHFFAGRTDLKLLREVVDAGEFDEVVIGGLRESNPLYEEFLSCVAKCPEKKIVSHLCLDELPSIIGERTVALIPNVVSDYTVSQDPMKLYIFLALGLNVIVPLQLVPHSIPIENIYLVGPGSGLGGGLKDWIDRAERTDLIQRKKFAAENSWQTRAEAIADRLV